MLGALFSSSQTGATGSPGKPLAHIDKVSIQVIAAKDLIDADGLGNRSDPYVKIKCGRKEKKTSVKSGTQNPTWNETYEISTQGLFSEHDLVFELWDSDLVFDDALGSAVVPLEDLKNGPRDAWLGLQKGNKAKGKLHVIITPYGRH
ncbi:C2 domain-containing protein [Blastocladiella britannica]|nr:C2 domain-containing protein [Blastocladiella britannica]